MAPIAATTPRLTLQILSPTEHLHAYHNLITDPATSFWSPNPINPSIEATLEKLKTRLAPPDKPWSQVWAICLKPVADERKDQEGEERDGMGVDEGCGRGNGKFIGTIGLPREAEIGYRISPEFWGKGYMSEVLEAFIEMFFKLDGKFLFCDCYF
jgi:[ribosomal protein S5]-alanine N-acetyltransferase